MSHVISINLQFIFPDNLDSAQAASQLHGLSLVRSTEPRLGQSQGALLVSLVRLSLILLAYLEPSSVRFLQACSRLRCLLHWSLEIIRESVTLGGYSVAFYELTAPLDRMVLAVVLHCHRALSRCSAVLAELESSPWDKYFSDLESRQKVKFRSGQHKSPQGFHLLIFFRIPHPSSESSTFVSCHLGAERNRASCI